MKTSAIGPVVETTLVHALALGMPFKGGFKYGLLDALLLGSKLQCWREGLLPLEGLVA